MLINVRRYKGAGRRSAYLLIVILAILVAGLGAVLAWKFFA